MASDQCIDDFVTLQRGNTYKSALLDQPGPYLLGLASIAREGGFRDDKLRTYGGHTSEKLLVYPGDIYVSLKDVTQSGDLLGSVARVPDRISLGRMTQDTVKLVFKENDAPKNYLYWVLRSPQYKAYCRARAMGTTNLSLSREDFLSYPVPKLTPARENLVAVLEAVEEKVTLNHQINQTLEEMAQALFKSWFVDFEPVKAKIAARQRWQALQPENEPASPVCYAAEFDQSPALGDLESYMNRAAMQVISGKTVDKLDALRVADPKRYNELYETAALFPSAMQASELGEIPEGWEVTPFDKLAKLDSSSIKPSDNPEKIWEHYSIPAFDAGKAPALDAGISIKSGKYKVKKTSVLISKLNPGTSRVWWPEPLDNESAICSTEFMQFVPKSEELRAFIAGVISSSPFQEGVIASVTGSTGSRQRAQPKQVARMDVVAPCEALALRYARQAQPLFTAQAKNINQSQKLAELRDTLLTKLLSGELTISDAEARMAEVADA
ncbi:hypothetical protein BFW38_00900 [Terasakiispira papahanaumokuakeensis]|uniref:Type I restriction modification DNA specificity domain-containing protein n=1 Tax=Terasakiispira papahanaumokuakeensis TaxID=197479 RepID=A0A1E2V626_9GAMM|nr:restriction endonuclease subunit S [Terasakiispira papahanaumokuakeensis]ODC02312.1 hypothetical protein BFW38_00900 [Terasakiispira papahanaumokuakeensis]